MRRISCGIPYKRRMRHKLSLCMLSNAFSKSTKLIYSCLCHSVHCSMMLRRVKIWSAHPLPFRNPACSLLSCLSIASEILCMMTFASILLGIDKRVIPRQLSQFFREPFLGIFTITPFDQSFGIVFPSHMDVKSGLSSFAESSGCTLNSSAFRLSCPGAFPFLSDLMAETIYFSSGGAVLISRDSLRFLYLCFGCWWGSV